MSGIINKVKDALHKDHHHSTTDTHSATAPGGYTGAGTGIHGTSGSTNAGPHDSNVANKLDPRIDSDQDNRAAYGTTGGYSSTGNHSTTGGYSSTGNSTNQGPHNSNIANKLDPRVDSDNDGSRNAGAASGTSGYGSSNTYSSGTTGYNQGSTNYGPHDSNVANKLDPRVDSDLDGSRNVGSGTGTGTHTGTHVGNSSGGYTGTSGGISHSTNAGPHSSNLANKADPRVDSDLDSTGNRHGASTGGVFGAPGSHATAGSGTAQNTAGPHNSDLLNKLDPRVDADRDGSRTYGGNATHQ